MTLLVADPLAWGGGIALVIAAVATPIVTIVTARRAQQGVQETNELLGGTEREKGLVTLTKETHSMVNSQHDVAQAEIAALKTSLTDALAEVRVLTGLLKATNHTEDKQ